MAPRRGRPQRRRQSAAGAAHRRRAAQRDGSFPPSFEANCERGAPSLLPPRREGGGGADAGVAAPRPAARARGTRQASARGAGGKPAVEPKTQSRPRRRHFAARRPPRTPPPPPPSSPAGPFQTRTSRSGGRGGGAAVGRVGADGGTGGERGGAVGAHQATKTKTSGPTLAGMQRARGQPVASASHTHLELLKQGDAGKGSREGRRASPAFVFWGKVVSRCLFSSADPSPADGPAPHRRRATTTKLERPPFSSPPFSRVSTD